MRLSHFEALKPLCPNCRNLESALESHLRIESVSVKAREQIVEGTLQCPNPNCLSEFPIIDGVPIIMPQLRKYVSDNIFHIVVRNDLSPTTKSILNDCCAQGSALDSMKQHLSSYVWDHYAEFDPNESAGNAVCSSLVRVLKHAWQSSNESENHSTHPGDSTIQSASLDSNDELPSIDFGCGPGRSTIELANHNKSRNANTLTLGIDMNFSMLRVASEMLRSRRITYPRRRVGVVYDERTFEVPFDNLEEVDFWACNALAFPFKNGTFGNAVAMNILDAISSPYGLLRSISNALAPNGVATLATPYDWTESVTPIEEWLGGHSQRGQSEGKSEPQLRRLMRNANQIPPETAIPLRIEREWLNVPWNVRIHERNSLNYSVHLLTARREAD